jgi:hypothetical protein
MKKLFTIFILLSAIFGGLSSSYAQNKRHVFSNHNNTVALLRINNQQKYLSTYQTQTTFTKLKQVTTQRITKSLIQIYDSIYMWPWDTIANDWANYPDSKTINMVYDINNNNLSKTEQNWSGSAWENYMKTTFSYDASNNQTSSLYQYWDGSAWVNGDLYTNTYDAYNNITIQLYQDWITSAWENVDMATYTYDASNNNTSLFYQYWDGSAWLNTSLTSYTYDVNNNMTGEVNQIWNGFTWVNSWQYTSINYDGNSNLISILYQLWVNNTWNNSRQSTYTYDANNNLTGGLDKSWNGNVWVNAWQFADTYDANNSKIKESGQRWDGSTWVNEYQRTYAYDVNNFEKSYTYKSWNNMGTKVTNGDSTYYYFHTVTGINDLFMPGKVITIYPNPATDMVTLNIDNSNNDDFKLNIYNESGELVRSKILKQNQQQINIGDLSNGIYMVVIKTKEWSKNQKLIIKK